MKIYTSQTQLLCDTKTPVSLFLALRDCYGSPLLLESSDYNSKNNHYSYLCFEPFVSFSIHQLNMKTSIKGVIENFGSGIDLIENKSGNEPYRYIASTNYEGLSKALDANSNDNYNTRIKGKIDDYNVKGSIFGFTLNLNDFTVLLSDRKAYLAEMLDDTTTPKLSDVVDRVRKLSNENTRFFVFDMNKHCLLYTSPSPRDRQKSRMPSSA